MLITYRLGTTDENAIREIFKQHCYFKKGFKPDEEDNWLDLGANIGCFTLDCMKLANSCVAVEPEPSNFEILKLNVSNNNLSNSVTIINKACTYDGNANLLYLCKSERNKYRHSVIKIKGRNTIKIDSISFKDLLQQFPTINAVKLDIEGSEMEILEKYDEWKRMRKIVFEWDFDRDKSVQRFYNVIDKLSIDFHLIYPKINRDKKQWDVFPSGVIVLCLNNKLYKTDHLEMALSSE